MKVENIKVYDFDESIKASKYPMNPNIDSTSNTITNTVLYLGSSNKGEGHDNFLSGIVVAFDLTFTNKAWVEAERYHFFQIVSSQSTMHRIAKFNLDTVYNEYTDIIIIKRMKELKAIYEKEPNKENYLKMLYSNPSGFEITARITTNYRQLKTIYCQRYNHKLPEWNKFCEWILTLPKFKELCLGDKDYK